ncbi:MAG: Gfo/Idh/MocA family oxidoreductase, partial [Planctomycetota bacterium]
PNRRLFLASAASVLGGIANNARLAANTLRNNRPVFGLIGAGYQPDTRRVGRGVAIGKQAAKLGDVTAICEIDSEAGEYAVKNIGKQRARLVRDYRTILEDPSIDAVLIATPDHWHTKIAIEAMRAGKDVYCEKPVATRIDEGKWLRETVEQTSRVLQVGTQQRSEYKARFLQAIALVRSGRIGKLKRVRIGLGPGWEGGPFQATAPPKTLDWDRWLGPAPETTYLKERTHRTFRWWYEYAGGQICDWGAHHVDIAQWAIGKTDSGPVEISGTARLNQTLDAGMPTRSDTYNTPIEFRVRCRFEEDIEFIIDNSRNGITFEGEFERFFVNRGTIEGKPVASFLAASSTEDMVVELYGGSKPSSHMQNFVDCMASRATPISDIGSHHRILTTCHLANIGLRLGRSIRWDPQNEVIVDDEEAGRLMSREYRSRYSIEGV